MSEDDTDYARSSPMILCVLCLEQVAYEANTAIEDPQRWFFAVPEMHRALGCALVTALAGSAEFGAYDEKLRKKWVAHYDKSDWPDQPIPSGKHTESVSLLLARVQDRNEPEMLGRPVVLSVAQQRDLAHLISIRGDMEHVKPGGWSIQTAGLPRLLAAAGEVIHQLLQEPRCRVELEEEDERRVDQALALIRGLAALSAKSEEGRETS